MLTSLTAVHTPRSEIGAEAARMLLALMRRDGVPQDAVDVGCRLVLRVSI
jgi:LacI family gluconate utilization system Gnt-I transcriptional repressor